MPKVAAARKRATALGSYPSLRGTAGAAWRDMILPVLPGDDAPSLQPPSAESYRTLKFRVLRSALIFGSWTFDLFTFPRRFVFSNRSVDTM